MLLSIICVVSASFIQLASEPDADEMLTEALVGFEELDESFCARFSGTLSGIQRDAPRILDVYGISAKHKKLEFHSYGTQGTVAQGIHPTIQWCDALRDMRNIRNRFKVSNEATTHRHPDLEFEILKNDDGTLKGVWPWPEIDPFGLVFGSESVMGQRRSELARLVDVLIKKFEFVGSRVLEGGNREGTWVSLPDKSQRLTIQFDRKFSNLPSLVKLEIVNEKRIAGLARTTWRKYEQNFIVPEKVSVITERADGTTMQLDIAWEWVPKDKWQDWAAGHFDDLFRTEVKNFRQPIVDLFETSDRAGGSRR